MEWLTNFNNAINGFVWGNGLYLLLATGVLMTVITGVFQITHIGHWFSETIGKIFKKDVSGHVQGKSISQFQALCTALAATKELVTIESAIETVKEFNGVEHRLEFIKELYGAKWYNDSIGSSPTRTIAGIKSFEEDIILIAGGYDKNLDYEPLAKPILDKVKGLILVGQTKEKIFDAVKAAEEIYGKKVDIYMCDTLEQTAMVAKRIVKPGQVVFFSPASASFDMFKNFDERGKRFKQIVNELL